LVFLPDAADLRIGGRDFASGIGRTIIHYHNLGWSRLIQRAFDSLGEETRLSVTRDNDGHGCGGIHHANMNDLGNIQNYLAAKQILLLRNSSAPRQNERR
jgi:hypothetical protein